MKKNTTASPSQRLPEKLRGSIERLFAQLGVHLAEFAPFPEDIAPDKPFILVGFPSPNDDTGFRFRFVQGGLGDLAPWLNAQVALIDIENKIAAK